MCKIYCPFTKQQKIFLYNIDSKYNFDNIKESKEKDMEIRENILEKIDEKFF